ncbi:Acetylxylan esterase 2 [Colletotrichum siamense]|nr:Acetylxylan esterase 2 [Colletotrichum siamense]
MHHQLSLSALACLAPLVLALPQPQQPPAPCAPVQIVVARGSLEAQGAGLLGNIANKSSMAIPGSIITPLVYPAQLDPYPPSVSAGVGNMTQLLTSQAQACPNTKFVLMGYSQVRSPASVGETSADMLQVAAVVLVGDPTSIATQPFQKGTAKKNGIFPRQDFGACQGLTSKFISFCDETDLFCASGQNLTVHLGYFQKQDYVDQAVNFVAMNSK